MKVFKDLYAGPYVTLLREDKGHNEKVTAEKETMGGETTGRQGKQRESNGGKGNDGRGNYGRRNRGEKADSVIRSSFNGHNHIISHRCFFKLLSNPNPLKK